MNNFITVTHQTLNSPREFCRIPVRYEIENDPLIQAPVVYCALDIPREHIPAWLNPVPMETTYFCHNGMHMILYNIGDVVSNDAREFCSKLYLSIMHAERSADLAEMAPSLPIALAALS